MAALVAEPGSAQGAGVGAEFVFSPGDRLQITVWPDSSLGGIFPVEESGLVHLPLLGALRAAGKTVPQFREELREGYARDLQLPAVTLQALFRVSIIGAVRSPGVSWVDPSYGVFELLSEAGGLADNAKQDGIVVTRATGASYQIDAELLQVPGSAESALALRAGDRVIVPKRSGWNWGIFLQSLTLVVTIANIASR